MTRLPFIIVFFVTLVPSLYAQITTDYNAPNNNPTHLIDNILLGGGVIANNHTYQGDTMQIGFFNGVNSNIGLDSGVVMSTGDISVLDPNFPGFGGNPNNIATDPDLLNVANSVPPLIGQTFTVGSINDVAVLEFDFIPTSDSLFFRYVFGSNEYLTFVNTTYNDVFGFFISGPGITGPYSAPAGFPNGSVNIATVPNSNPALPITISSVNNVLNSPYYIDNQNTIPQTVACNGFTSVFTAKAQVQCGETYHIRLAIADGTDNALDSWVFLEAGSFTSPELDVSNSLGIDSTNNITVDCNTTIDISADMGVASATYLWSTGENTQTITVGPGTYWVEATNSLNCSIISDTIYIVGSPSQSIDLGPDVGICLGNQAYLTPTINGGTAPFNYLWSNASILNSIEVGPGTYDLVVTDAMGCMAYDTIEVTSHLQPQVLLSGGGVACADGTQVNVVFDLVGTQPYQMVYTDGSQQYSINNLNLDQYILSTNTEGTFEVLSIQDANCSGIFSGSATVELKPLPFASLTGGGVICPFDSAQVSIEMLGTLPYSLELSNGFYSLFFDSITSPILSFYTNQNGNYSLSKLTDGFGCIASNLDGAANITVLDYVQPTIFPISDTLICAVDSAFQLTTLNPGGEWSGVGINAQGVFDPRRAGVGQHWVYYQMEYNCQEIDSIPIEVGCDLQIFVPNTFTPNGDDHNELLVISGNNILEFSFVVYSQWGQKLFETNQLSDFWDGSYKGKTVPVGVYSYHITAYGKDDQFVSKTGTVNILK